MAEYRYLIKVESDQKYPGSIHSALWDALDKLRRYGAIGEWKCKVDNSQSKDDSQNGNAY